MNAAPMRGTARTENAPAVTTPTPYRSSQSPGRARGTVLPGCHMPRRSTSANVSTAPARMAGQKPNRNLRAGTLSTGDPVDAHAAAHLAPHHAAAEERGHDGLGHPHTEPSSGAGLRGREPRCAECRRPDGDQSPSRHVGEGGCALHRASDEGEVLDGAVVKRRCFARRTGQRSGHARILSPRRRPVKYFALQSIKWPSFRGRDCLTPLRTFW